MWHGTIAHFFYVEYETICNASVNLTSPTGCWKEKYSKASMELIYGFDIIYEISFDIFSNDFNYYPLWGRKKHAMSWYNDTQENSMKHHIADFQNNINRLKDFLKYLHIIIHMSK